MRTVDEQSKIFLGVFDEMKQMQHRHAEVLALASGAPEDVLLRLQEEHGRLFARLKEILDKVVGGFARVESGGEEAAFYGQAVQELFEGERTLRMTAARQKDRLAERMQKLRCGKRSLLGYRSAAAGSARPRFLNSKT